VEVSLSLWPGKEIICLSSRRRIIVMWRCLFTWLFKKIFLCFKAHFLLFFKLRFFFDICIFNILQFKYSLLNFIDFVIKGIVSSMTFCNRFFDHWLFKWRVSTRFLIVKNAPSSTHFLRFWISNIWGLLIRQLLITKYLTHYFRLISVWNFCIYSSRRQLPLSIWIRLQILLLLFSTFHRSINGRGKGLLITCKNLIFGRISICSSSRHYSYLLVVCWSR